MLRTERIPASHIWAEVGDIADHHIFLGEKLLLDVSEAGDLHTTKWQTSLSDTKAIVEIIKMQDAFAKKHYQSKAYIMPEVSIQTDGIIVLNQCPIYEFLNQDNNGLSLLSNPGFQLLRIDFPGKTTGTAFCYDKSLPNSPPHIGIISNFNMSEFLPKWIKSTSTNGNLVSEKEIQLALERIYGRYPAPN